MNIFKLDRNAKKAAEYHCDKHVVKMLIEYAQLMSTAHRVLDGDEESDKLGLYKTAYKNHPCTIWARETSGNYRWLYNHFIEIGRAHV